MTRLPLVARVLVAMVLPTLALMAVMFVVFDRVATDRSRSTSIDAAHDTAQAVAKVAARAKPGFDYSLFGPLVGDSQLLVYRGDQLVYRGAPDSEPGRFTVTAPFDGGRVVVIGDVEDEVGQALQLTAVAAAVFVIVLIVGVVGSLTLTRAVRRPVDRAVGAADRLAAGDFGARIEHVEPGPFTHLAGAFNSMAERLEGADRAQERFLSDLAHELATPLNAVIGLAGAAVDGALTGPEERAEAASLLEAEADRMRTLLSALRNVHLLEHPDQGRWGEVELGGVVDGVGRRFAPVVREAGQTLEVETGSGTVRAAPDLLDRVLDNLMTNAVRYTGRDGTIGLRSYRRGPDMVVAVSDTGIGVAPGDRERIFDRFYRVDAARDRASGGTGLGLSIARAAATALGGRIELDSSPGAGSEFRLVLPAMGGGEPPAPSGRRRDTARVAGSSDG